MEALGGEAQEGQYGISDDGYVAECIYRKEYGDKVEYTYPYGRQWLTAWVNWSLNHIGGLITLVPCLQRAIMT